MKTAYYQLYGGEPELKLRTAILVNGVVLGNPRLLQGKYGFVLLRFRGQGSAWCRLVVVSVHLPYDTQALPLTLELDSLVSSCGERGLELVIGCDSNTHPEVWVSLEINGRGKTLVKYEDPT